MYQLKLIILNLKLEIDNKLMRHYGYENFKNA